MLHFVLEAHNDITLRIFFVFTSKKIILVMSKFGLTFVTLETKIN